MDCFERALEYLMRATMERYGVTGEITITKIEEE